MKKEVGLIARFHSLLLRIIFQLVVKIKLIKTCGLFFGIELKSSKACDVRQSTSVNAQNRYKDDT